MKKTIQFNGQKTSSLRYFTLNHCIKVCSNICFGFCSFQYVKGVTNGNIIKLYKVWEYIPTIMWKWSLKHFFNFDSWKRTWKMFNIHLPLTTTLALLLSFLVWKIQRRNALRFEKCPKCIKGELKGLHKIETS